MPNTNLDTPEPLPKQMHQKVSAASTAQLEAVLRRQNRFDAQFAAANQLKKQSDDTNVDNVAGASSTTSTNETATRTTTTAATTDLAVTLAQLGGAPTIATQSPGLTSIADMMMAGNDETSTAELQSMLRQVVTGNSIGGGGDGSAVHAPGTAEVLDTLLDMQETNASKQQNATITTTASDVYCSSHGSTTISDVPSCTSSMITTNSMGSPPCLAGSSQNVGSPPALASHTATTQAHLHRGGALLVPSVVNPIPAARAGSTQIQPEPPQPAAPMRSNMSNNNESSSMVISVRIGDRVVEVPVPIEAAANSGDLRKMKVNIETEKPSSQHQMMLNARAQMLDNASSPYSVDDNPTMRSSSAAGRRSRSPLQHLPDATDSDERRQTVLERNKQAAVRYRKRKREEQQQLADTLGSLKRENMELETRLRVLSRELSSVTEKLRRYELRCTCDARSLAQQATTSSYRIDDDGNHNNATMVNVEDDRVNATSATSTYSRDRPFTLVSQSPLPQQKRRRVAQHIGQYDEDTLVDVGDNTTIFHGDTLGHDRFASSSPVPGGVGSRRARGGGTAITLANDAVATTSSSGNPRQFYAVQTADGQLMLLPMGTSSSGASSTANSNSLNSAGSLKRELR